MQQVHCNGSKCAKLKQQKEKPVNTNSTQKSLLGLKLNYFQELEWETVEFVQLKRNSGMLVTYEPIKYKAWEPAESHNSSSIISVTAQVGVCIRCRGTGSLFVDLHFPYIASRLQGDACYFSAPCDSTS